MDSKDIRSRSLAILKEFLKNPGEWQKVADGGPLLETSSFDSLSMVNFVVELEIEFGIRIDTDELTQSFDSLDSLTAHLAAQLAAQSSRG
jgi:acyl carrier protein